MLNLLPIAWSWSPTVKDLFKNCDFYILLDHLSCSFHNGSGRSTVFQPRLYEPWSKDNLQRTSGIAPASFPIYVCNEGLSRRAGVYIIESVPGSLALAVTSSSHKQRLNALVKRLHHYDHDPKAELAVYLRRTGCKQINTYKYLL